MVELEEWRPIQGSLDVGELRTRVLDAFVRTQSYLAPFYERWLKYYRMYRSISPERRRIWRANVFVPIPFAEVEHGLADWMEYWFGRKPMAQVTPREGGDYRAAKILETYLDWEADDIPLWLPMYEAGKEVLLYGTAWQKVLWDWKLDRNHVEAISVWQMYPDASADNVDDAQWFIERRLRPRSWVRRMIRMGVYDLDEDELDRLSGAGLRWSGAADQIVGISGLSHDIWRDTIEVIEAWLAEPNAVVTILNREKVVRAHINHFPHGWKPYVRWVDYHLKGEMFGIGELEIIEKLVHEINDIRNQRLDAVTLMLNNVLVANRTAGIDPDDLEMRPGAIIWANDPNAIRPLVQHAPIPIGWQEEQVSRFDIQQATGNWGYNQGQTPTRRETATTVLALQRASSKRFGLKLRMAEETSFRRQVQMRIVSAQHFLPPERVIRVAGQAGIEPEELVIRRDDLRGSFDFVTSVVPPEPREAKRAQLAQILPLLLQHPMVNQRALLDWLLDLYGLGKDKTQFLLSDEEAAQQAAVLQWSRPGGRAQGVASPDLGAPSVRVAPPGLEELADAEASPVLQDLLAQFQSEGGGGDT